MVTYDDAKRQTNLAKHGIDLADCDAVFDSPMVTREDTREDYGEQRLRSLGWFAGRVVVLVWTEREKGPHIISCRFGESHETKRYFKAVL